MNTIRLLINIYILIFSSFYYINCLISPTIKNNSINKISNASIFASNMGYTFINITLGKKSTFKLLFNTISTSFWVPEENSKDRRKIIARYKSNESSTFKPTDIKFTTYLSDGGIVRGILANEIITLGELEFNGTFGLSNLTNFPLGADASGTLGLMNDFGRNEDSEGSRKNLSIIYQMKTLGIIDSFSFSIKFNYVKNETEKHMIEYDLSSKTGYLFFGIHKDFLHDNKKNVVTCKLLHDNEIQDIHWTCRGTGIILEKKDVKVTTDRLDMVYIFDAGAPMIILPYSYLEYINSTLNEIDCEISDNNIICNSSGNFESLPKIKLIIGRDAFELPKDLIYRIENTINTFVLNIEFSRNSDPIIGYPFFLAYHTLFDYEKQKLRFFPNKNVIIERKAVPLKIIYMLDCIVVISIFITIIIYFICLCLKKKRNKDFKYKKIREENDN